MMHRHEKSDPAIVAMKPANKVEQLAAEQPAAVPTAAESGEVELAPCLRPLAQTARAVFPQAAFLCGRHCGVEDGLMPGTR